MLIATFRLLLQLVFIFIKRSSLIQINMKFSPLTVFELKFRQMYFFVKSILPEADYPDITMTTTNKTLLQE